MLLHSRIIHMDESYIVHRRMDVRGCLQMADRAEARAKTKSNSRADRSNQSARAGRCQEWIGGAAGLTRIDPVICGAQHACPTRSETIGKNDRDMDFNGLTARRLSMLSPANDRADSSQPSQRRHQDNECHQDA